MNEKIAIALITFLLIFGFFCKIAFFWVMILPFWWTKSKVKLTSGSTEEFFIQHFYRCKQSCFDFCHVSDTHSHTSYTCVCVSRLLPSAHRSAGFRNRWRLSLHHREIYLPGQCFLQSTLMETRLGSSIWVHQQRLSIDWMVIAFSLNKRILSGISPINQLMWCCNCFWHFPELGSSWRYRLCVPSLGNPTALNLRGRTHMSPTNVLSQLINQLINFSLKQVVDILKHLSP